MISAERTLSQLLAEQKELNITLDVTEHELTSLMTDIQRSEAKRSNLEQLVSRSEEEVVAQRARLDGSKMHVEKLEKDVIPSIEHEANSLNSHITLLRDEMDTESSITLTEDESNLLEQLKIIQTELDADIEAQTQSLDEISIERERLLSLLNVNLVRRKAELETNSVPDRLRSQDVSISTSLAVAQLQWQENLDVNGRSLHEASQSLDDIASKLEQAKLVDESLRAELSSSKAKLEKLQVENAEYKKKLETAQENEEKLMTKVSHLIFAGQTSGTGLLFFLLYCFDRDLCVCPSVSAT